MSILVPSNKAEELVADAIEFLRLNDGPKQEDHTRDNRPGWFTCETFRRNPAISDDCDCGVYRRFRDEALEVADRMSRTILDLAAPPKQEAV